MRNSTTSILVCTATLLMLMVTGCEKLLDEHDKVDVDYCGGYKGADECCDVGDSCGLATSGACECNGCSWDVEDCTMTFTFTDVCDDGAAISVGIYQWEDTGVQESWEGMTLDTLGVQESIQVDCTPSSLVCYGAWSQDSAWFWGCSENCQEYCETCCYSCDLQGTVVMQLGCS